MGIEQEAQAFVAQLAQLYFVRRDIGGLLAQMRPDTSWLGTGQREISQNLEEAKVSLEKEFAEYSGCFQILQKELYAKRLSQTVCLVYGLLQAMPEDALVEEQKLHLTAVCVQSAAGMKLAHCNVSRPDSMLTESSYYVPAHTRADNQSLRSTLESRERWLRNLTHNIPGGVHQCLNDPNLTLVDMSESFLELFGFTKTEIKAQFDNRFINMVYPDDRAEMLRTINGQLAKGTATEAEYRVVSKNNGPVWILDKGRLLEDGNGRACFYCVLIDITQRKREQEQLRLSLERHRIIMDQAADIIFEWDIAADTLDFSSNWRKKFGYEALSACISRDIPVSENIHHDDIPAFIKIMRDIAAGVPYSEVEFRIRDITGRYWWNRIRATAQFDSTGRPIKAVGVITDISAEKKERLALLEQAQRDALTGLYNKAAIKTQVEQCMEQENSGAMQALLIIDIDHFKQVNDTYGHLCGDTLLSDIAQVLKRHFRASDPVGRIGGDEFLVYLPQVENEATVRNKVQSVLGALAKVRLAPDLPPLSCSVGAVVLPRKGTDYLSLYKAADRALYQRKSEGRNGVSFYTPALCENVTSGLAHSAVSERIDSEQHSAVEEKLAQYTFQMLYQSIDVEPAVNRLLEIVGRAYGVSRVYIFESSEDGLRCNNTFEWCAPDVSPEIDNLQGIRYAEDLGGYLQNFNQDGVFYCHDVRKLHPSLHQVLAPQGIRSLLQCAVLDRGRFKGYVGFDECKENCLWSKEQIRSLTLIANTLSVFLVKLRLEQQLEKQNQPDAQAARENQ